MHTLYSPIGYIFQNLPGGIFNDIVRILLSIELTLTFPIVIKPATDVMEEILKNVLTVRVVCVYPGYVFIDSLFFYLQYFNNPFINKLYTSTVSKICAIRDWVVRF